MHSPARGRRAGVHPHTARLHSKGVFLPTAHLSFRRGVPPLFPASQDGVRIHTISRETGQLRIWPLPMAFLAYYDGHAYDTEGA